MIGRRLSHYTIEARLGKGGMGEVYQARDSRLERVVAIKTLPETSVDDQSVRRFLKEARAASSLNHPNIVTVHAIEQEDSLHYIVMEKVDGAPLSTLVREPLTLERFLDIALQITSAMGAAHAAGIIHRDLKPANVMLTSSGVVKVVDFGLARLMRPEASSGAEDPTVEWSGPLTRQGAVMGTIGYMAPEQVEGQRATSRSDVFALGVVFYEILTRKAAFRTSTPASTFAAILRDSPPPLSSVRPDLPPALEEIVDRCLAKDPADRFADAGEIHAALLELRRSLFERPATVRRRRLPLLVGAGVAAALIVGILAALWWRHDARIRWARNVAPGEIERLMDGDPVAAFMVAKRAKAIAPDDSQVQQAWTNLMYPVTLESEPPGAEVEIRSYRGSADSPWVSIGRTPLRSIDLPFPMLRYRVSLDGYVTSESAPAIDGEKWLFRLYPPAETPARMVPVAGGPSTFGGRTVTLPDFWIDQYEVTNVEFKAFVDAGGYGRRELWKHPFTRGGTTLSWEEAMRGFVDQTGQPGPAGWELGSFATGLENHPVEGISWYEAVAYADFVGKSLPTVFHWRRAAANDGIFSDVLALSNFEGEGVVPVGSLGGLGNWGTYDMAGNVREWCINAVDQRRYALGGSWVDPGYTYVEQDAQDPMSRRAGYGTRLISVAAPIPEASREDVSPSTFEVPPPVDDATFRLVAGSYAYDPIPVNGRTEEIDDTHDGWRKERVSFDAAYGGERITAFVFIPKNAQPPYQAIVYFPGSDATFTNSSRHLWLRMVEFYIRSGRVLVFPIYKGTYERQVAPPQGQNARRDLRIQQVKDIGRTLDYLQERSDIDRERIAYYGLSLGASLGALATPLETRFRSSVLFGTGFYGDYFTPDRPPETQPHHFLPRIEVPTLLVGGRYDFLLPLESAQKPFFDMIGTSNKKHVVFDGGHVPTQFNDVIREILAWTDQWMGPVQRSSRTPNG